MSASSPQQTRWSLVSRARGDTPEARMALSELCEIYYAPVLSFVRIGSSADEARDLTHAFFESILSHDSLTGADQNQGRFRNYLLGAVKHFLCETRAKELRQKRGRQFEHIGIDSETLHDTGILPPDVEFDRAWACTLLDRSLIRLANEMEETGKIRTYTVLRPWLVGTSHHGNQIEAATELGISETAVRVLVHRLRSRFREIIVGEITQTLAPGADPIAELILLLAVW